ncbi:hypothetical protein GCM10027176_11220 [Actinoallomurus bryophytorum]
MIEARSARAAAGLRVTGCRTWSPAGTAVPGGLEVVLVMVVAPFELIGLSG